MDKVYIIRFNDGLLTEEAYLNFDMALYVCETMLGIRPEEINRICEVEPMKYVKITELHVA